MNLSRDYKQNPLKRGERPAKEDIEYLYLECNYNIKQVAEVCNTHSKMISMTLKLYKIEKSREMKAESQRQYFLKTKGVINPAQTKEALEKKKQTLLERYGVDNPNKCKEIRERGKKTCLERYGVENPAQLKEVQDKMRKTMQKHYGVEHSSQAQQVKDKKQKTMQERYGCSAPMQNPELKEKIQQTNLERYGTRNPFQAKKCQEKQRKTLQERYGVQNGFQIPEAQEKHKQTCFVKYGVEYINQNPAIRHKGKQTCLEKYGVANPSQLEEIKEKKRQSCLLHYGVDNPNKCPEIRRKSNQTKKEKGTYNKSSDAVKILGLLCAKFDIVEDEYDKDPRYPYSCDFYIPELDLFIEYQGFVTHGNEPYDSTNEAHQKIVEDWKQKATQVDGDSLYASAVHTWTIRDPKKRKTAKENNLNWIEFFSMQEFMEWYNSIGE